MCINLAFVIETTMDMVKKFEWLLSNNENECLEFKTASKNFDSDDLWKYFSALSNEANLQWKKQARLVFWVNDNHEVVWTNFRNDSKSLQSLKKEIWNQTSNSITFSNIHEIFYEWKRILMFEIPAAPQWMPVYWKWHLYWRSWESLEPLNPQKYELIRNKNPDWSAEICPEATIDDLDSEAILRARELYTVKNPSKKEEIQSRDDVTFLNKAKITIHWKITNTAILLLWKPESEPLLSPAIAKISWILRNRDWIEVDYQHFSCPFILTINEVCAKIRNLKYRYIVKDSLFPEEVDKYDSYTIREALNNCIAHQDYTMWWKINIVENEDSLVFSNSWSFIPETIENVIESDSPSDYYRNRFLADAMVNLNMIDTIWSWIKRMFILQREKLFPLPEYNISKDKVSVTIIGKVLDINYARKLAKIPNLSLVDIMLLDKVQKWKTLTKDEVKALRKKNLIEWKSPNFIISSDVANETDQKSEYIQLRWIDDEYSKKIIIDYIKEFWRATRKGLEKTLISKLPDVLSEKQKKDKIKNLLQSLKKEGKIIVDENSKGRAWILVSSKS